MRHSNPYSHHPKPWSKWRVLFWLFMGQSTLLFPDDIYLFQSKGEIDKTGQFELFLPLLRICFCIPETAKIISIHDFGRLFNFQVVNRRKTLYFVYNTVCKKQEGATDCVFCVF